MEGEGRLKLIVAGLILAAFAVGYFILAQRFQGTGTISSSPKPTTQANIVITSPSPSGSPALLGQTAQGTTKGGLVQPGVSSLPRTGFPVPLAAVFSVSAIVSGYFLRRYPN